MSRGNGGVREFLLAFADDEHLMGQQHTEWIGVAPFLEEDLATSSIGQDELGHAALLYELVLELDGVRPGDAAVDALAYGRAASEYRSCHLVEYATADWAEALVRHWLYDAIEEMRWGLLVDSSLPQLAAIAERAKREEAFHSRHADALVDALIGSPEARPRILTALRKLAPMAEGVLEPVGGEREAIDRGITARSGLDLLAGLHEAVAIRFGIDQHHPDRPGIDQHYPDRLGMGWFGLEESGFADPEMRIARLGQSQRTQRSGDFAPLMSRMREVLDFDPAAVW